MCGILCHFGNEIVNENHPGLQIIEHRGPDGKGAVNFEANGFNLSLAHRRLSIIDLSNNGSQPMTYSDSGYWITYNGEVYNFKSIRSELKKRGYCFTSQTDTEVIICAYIEYGEKCLELFNGMFSFAIFDNNKKELFVARDRFGIKPLYYYNSKNNLTLCSEIKQITQFKDFVPKINYDVAYQYLNYGDLNYNNKTIWSDIEELDPGHFIKLKLNQWIPGETINPVRWYSLEEKVSSYKTDIENYIEEFSYLLEDSIKLRMISDVQIGALLSGGLDSSTIVSFITKNFNQKYPLRTFSAIYDEEKFSEKKYIDILARKLAIESHSFKYKPEDMHNIFSKLIWHADIPTVGRSIFAHNLLYQEAKKNNVTVVLEGQGGDELLGGYHGFPWALITENLLNLDIIKAFRNYSSFNNLHPKSLYKAVKLIKLHLKGNPVVNNENADYLDREFFRNNTLSIKNEVTRFSPSMEQMHYNRFKILRSILSSVDRASMASSIETRVPFLDHRLAEFSISLPPALKINKGTTKHILRESMKNVLPYEITNRKDKMGFTSPEEHWAKNESYNFYIENIKSLKEIPFINYKEVINGFSQFKKGKKGYNNIFWRLISLNEWLKIFKINL